MTPLITKEDLDLINTLSSRNYTDNRMISNASSSEIEQFNLIKNKLKQIANDLKSKYESDYGNLELSVSAGNPIAIGGVRLNRLWSGLFKGATNKQYSAQISFVMNPQLPCLDVGFYFGRASARNLSKSQKNELENRLLFLGQSLENEISNDKNIHDKFEALFDYGFQAYSSGEKVSSTDWLNAAKNNPTEIQIIYRIYANDEGYIETTTIGLYISMIIFLMSLIPSADNDKIVKIIKPLTAEQRAKQAERRTLIGEKGELLVFENELEKLKSLNIDPSQYLKHVALESTNYGYDILSCDENKNEIYIEVKTTTRTKEDINAKQFFMSSNEFEFYKKNINQFRLFRVYNIEGENPEVEIIDMNSVKIETDSYLIKY